MKSLKKALAVLLSVLMVAFSFPLSAWAIPNPDNDGTWSEDEDVSISIAVVDYTARNEWGYDSSDTLIMGDDVKHLSRDDLASSDGTFAVVFYVSGLDSLSNWTLAYAFDTSMVNNAYIDRREIVTGPDAASDALLDIYEGYYDGDSEYLDGFSSANYNGINDIFLAGVLTPQDDPAEETDLSFGDEAMIVPGAVLGVVGMQMASGLDEIDLTQAIKPYLNTVDSQIATQFGNDFKNLYLAGSSWKGGYTNPETGELFTDGTPCVEATLYSMPQWGLGVEEEPEPEDVTYTYTFAGGESTQVSAPAGEAPTAPENTANTDCVSNEDGTHTYNTYSWPAWEDGTLEYKEVATPVTEDCNMEETEAAVAPVHADGESLPGKTAVMTCTECGYQTGGEVIPAAEHVYSAEPDLELSTPATCVATGTNVYVCSVCGDTMEEEAPIDPDAHHIVTDAAVDATCTTSGLTEGSHCDLCGATIVEQEVIPELGHDFSVQVGSSDATCVTPGTTTYKCSRCDETKVVTGEVNPNNHEGEVTLDQSTVKAATRGEDGYTGDYKCSACGEVVTSGEVIPALGVMITVEQNELGTTTLNSEATTGEAQKVPYTENYTLVASPAADAEFIGWSVNGKLISTDATYTTAAYADLTYVPVFAEKTADFTVTFVDQFNMVLDTMSSSEVAELEAMPETYDYLGYTFADWSMSLEDVKALEANAVVTAYYAKDDALTYTVSAPGCVITVGEDTYNDTAVVGFDESVTVAPAEGTATAWTVNGNNAAYGAEYTFYVTSDVEVAFTSDEVTAVPTVAAVDVTPTESGQVRFLATRNVPAGYTVLESGFVYGKDYAEPETDLVLENATTGTCYLYKNSNTAGDGQFALTFGISTQTGTAYARAYVIAADAEGNAAVYYADVQSYAYGA